MSLLLALQQGPPAFAPALPEDELETLKVAPGFRVELVRRAERDVEDPWTEPELLKIK